MTRFLTALVLFLFFVVHNVSEAETLEDAFRMAPEKLNAITGQTLKIAIGEIKFEGVVPSVFGEYLSSELSALLSRLPNYEEISRKDLRRILEEQKLSLSGIIHESSVIRMGQLKGVEVIVGADFWEIPGQIKINLSFVSTETGKRFTVCVLLPRNQIPPAIQIKPENYQAMTKALELWGESNGQSKDLKIKVWVDSPNSTYKVGETIVVHFVANKNCYVRLFHTDSQGAIHQLFPNVFGQENHIKANDVNSIPTDAMGFTFEASQPCGADILKIVASTQPFKEEDLKFGDGEIFKDLGFSDAKTIARIRRGINVVPVNQRIEATCIFTTIDK